MLVSDAASSLSSKELQQELNICVTFLSSVVETVPDDTKYVDYISDVA